MRGITAFSAVAALWLASASTGIAAPSLTVLCGVDETWCAAMKTAYEAKTGLEISVTRKSTGDILNQIRAEKTAPTVDVWWGGTGDTHLQAGSENLLEPYQPAHERDMLPWAQNFFAMSGGRSAGIYAGALGFAYNADLLRELKLPAPTCWKDLTDVAYRGRIQSGNPNSSGTAFTTLATLVQLFGEDEAFRYLAALNRNIERYTPSGAAPIKAAARGETLIGISFMHDAVTQKQAGFPLVIVAPCEGTGYEIGAVSIVKGARHIEEAKRFVDFALSPEGQGTGAASGQNQVPSNAKSTLPLAAPDISMIKMVDYDFATFGSPDERSRLLRRFDAEIAATN
ncbi:iron ABC transporter substrate-binding protein [Rhizobium anhuiense]|uniref:ABC transporter substrate-binding protein n=1 Tax=Rhizobium anhuiense TaxID=1184720 RepID=A0A3S0XTM9_9HYPH|nr:MULTISPECIES: ABC transporter substrate-binding protein [Rhizobium]MBB3298851.1 iron(III) transport system substrate-binding protein [Rhizobium sp. BK112]MBB3367241.1 iron(III) transport system substrate-binding protein [Rhizobium sp. BK077]MBB3742069.1 iron(III) transport system substrate-binding protein [Rhizobium sp. BK591]MBB4111903.1 iron(III) transport system substrate-binding protein [Rhizobium sp. BK226]MBB4178743.1 iron(III) transport system substrate-binding protein [Rhizobium sp.